MRSQNQPEVHPKFRGQLKPFDLKKALSGSPVVTRLGYPVSGVRRLGHEVHGVVCGEISHWSITGSFPMPGPAPRILDLFIGVPAKETFLARLADRLEAFVLGRRAA